MADRGVQVHSLLSCSLDERCPVEHRHHAVLQSPSLGEQTAHLEQTQLQDTSHPHEHVCMQVTPHVLVSPPECLPFSGPLLTRSGHSLGFFLSGLKRSSSDSQVTRDRAATTVSDPGTQSLSWWTIQMKGCSVLCLSKTQMVRLNLRQFSQNGAEAMHIRTTQNACKKVDTLGTTSHDLLNLVGGGGCVGPQLLGLVRGAFLCRSLTPTGPGDVAEGHVELTIVDCCWIQVWLLILCTKWTLLRL